MRLKVQLNERDECFDIMRGYRCYSGLLRSSIGTRTEPLDTSGHVYESARKRVIIYGYCNT